MPRRSAWRNVIRRSGAGKEWLGLPEGRIGHPEETYRVACRIALRQSDLRVDVPGSVWRSRGVRRPANGGDDDTGMAIEHKPLWIEGMFMRPHHFQQYDRYLESRLEARAAGLRAHGWGLTALELDASALVLGKVAVARLSGVMPDGTPVEIPAPGLAVAPREVPARFANRRVFLALPMRAGHMPEIDPDGDGRVDPRFLVAGRGPAQQHRALRRRDRRAGGGSEPPARAGRRAGRRPGPARRRPCR